MKKVYRCKNCFTQNSVEINIKPPSGIAYCGKCHKPIVKFDGSDFLFRVSPSRKRNSKAQF